MEHIASAQNSRIKHLAKLAASAAKRRAFGQTLLEGTHLLEAFLNAGGRPECVYVAENRLEDAEISALLQRMPSEKTVLQIQKQRVKAATRPFSMELITTLDDIRKQNEQKIDAEIDEVIHAGWAENDETLTQDFAEWIRSNKDEITALQIFYNQPYQRQALSLAMIKELATAIKKAKPKLAFNHIWQAYARLDNVSEQAESELTALVSLVRRVIGIDDKITPFAKTVRKNFQT